VCERRRSDDAVLYTEFTLRRALRGPPSHCPLGAPPQLVGSGALARLVVVRAAALPAVARALLKHPGVWTGFGRANGRRALPAFAEASGRGCVVVKGEPAGFRSSVLRQEAGVTGEDRGLETIVASARAVVRSGLRVEILMEPGGPALVTLAAGPEPARRASRRMRLTSGRRSLLLSLSTCLAECAMDLGLGASAWRHEASVWRRGPSFRRESRAETP
jgi:hypothetical protein